MRRDVLCIHKTNTTSYVVSKTTRTKLLIMLMIIMLMIINNYVDDN